MINITAIYTNENDTWIVIHSDMDPSDLKCCDDSVVTSKRWHSGTNRQLFICLRSEKWCGNGCDPESKKCSKITFEEWKGSYKDIEEMFK